MNPTLNDAIIRIAQLEAVVPMRTKVWLGPLTVEQQKTAIASIYAEVEMLRQKVNLLTK